jgi:hypothetical protein
LYRRLIYVSPWVTVSSSSPAKSFWFLFYWNFWIAHEAFGNGYYSY